MKPLPTILFVLYFLLLVKLILIKGPVFYQVVPTSKEYISKAADSSLVSVNLRPFATIKKYIYNDAPDSVKAFNILGNILLFVPYGFLLPLVFRKRLTLFAIFYSAVIVSFCFELFQYITRTGQFDVDDILLNTTGGVTGFLLLKLCRTVWETKTFESRTKKSMSQQR